MNNLLYIKFLDEWSQFLCIFFENTSHINSYYNLELNDNINIKSIMVYNICNIFGHNKDIYTDELSVEFINKYIDNNWNMNYISSSKIIIENPDIIIKHSTLHWNYNILSKNIHILFILENDKLNWNWSIVSENKSLTIHIVINNLKKYNWNWKNISLNENIYWNDIIENPNLPWSWNEISQNKNITWNIVCKNIDKPWQYDYMSMNENITWEIFFKNLDKKWSMEYLVRNKNITFDIIKKNKHFYWNIRDFIKYNPNITLDFIEKNYEDYMTDINKFIYTKSFDKDRNEFIKNCYKKYFTENVLNLINEY